MQGDPEEGITQMRQYMANKPVGSYYAIRPWLYAMYVEAYSALGQTGEGLSQVAEALALVEKSGFRFYEAELRRLHGELLLMQSAPDTAGAETCLQQALDLAAGQQAKSLELRAAVSLSRLWGQQNRKAEAQNLLTEIYDWFSEGFDTADLKEAKALLEDLSG
jgi:predicted ATPase